MPVSPNPLEVKRRELALDLVLEGEIELDRIARLAVVQGCAGFAEIVVAVVTEIDNLAANAAPEAAAPWRSWRRDNAGGRSRKAAVQSR